MNKSGILEQILDRIESFKSEEAFAASDFADIAEPDSVWQALSRLERSGKIQRAFRGIYYKPQFSFLLGEYEAPSPHNVALALARKFNWTIAPSGNTALNLLGLSTQVSAKWSYISDGPYNNYTIGSVTLEFKRRSNKDISGLSYKTALVIQALRTLGKNNVKNSDLKKIREFLTNKERETLLNESRQTTAWIYSYIKKICLPGENSCIQ